MDSVLTYPLPLLGKQWENSLRLPVLNFCIFLKKKIMGTDGGTRVLAAEISSMNLWGESSCCRRKVTILWDSQYFFKPWTPLKGSNFPTTVSQLHMLPKIKMNMCSLTLPPPPLLYLLLHEEERRSPEMKRLAKGNKVP